MKTSMHPRRWHLATWALVLLWLVATIAGNYPVKPPSGFEDFENFGDPALGKGTVAYSVAVVNGFPFLYREQRMTQKSNQVNTTVHHHLLMANIVVATAALLSLVFCLQRLERFSIKILLGGIALAAVVIVVGQMVVERYRGFSVHYFVTAVYCLPIVVAVVIGIATIARRGHREQETSGDAKDAD